MQASKLSPMKNICRNINSIYDSNGVQRLVLHLRMEQKSKRVFFDYNEVTLIKELFEFIRNQVSQHNIYLKVDNLQLEYLLTLLDHKVIELRCSDLTVHVQRIEIQDIGNGLRNIEVLRCIGTGGFSKVFVGRGYGKLMALKVMNKSLIVDCDKKYIVENQRYILAASSGHPFITKLYLTFETKNYIVFCMEYCNGGELFNLLKKVKKMKENEARFYFLQTLAAITYLHSQRILYRDLKPQNIIIDADGHIRLADYGLSKRLDEGKTFSFCGSAQYMAPEMLLKKGHSYEIDYYCLGALIYELVYGLPPYYSQNQDQLFYNILNQELQFPTKVQTTLEFKIFVRKLLQKKVNLRFQSTQEIFKHPWLKNIRVENILKKQLIPPFKTNMHIRNIDDTQFGPEQIAELQKIKRERNDMNPFKKQFQNFQFESSQIDSLKRESSKTRLNFAKNKPRAYLNSEGSSKASSDDTRNTFLRKENHKKDLLNNKNQSRENNGFEKPILTGESSSLRAGLNPSFLFSSTPSLVSALTAPGPSHISSAPTSILNPNEIFVSTNGTKDNCNLSGFRQGNNSTKNIYTGNSEPKLTYDLGKGKSKMSNSINKNPMNFPCKNVSANMVDSKQLIQSSSENKIPYWQPRLQGGQKKLLSAALCHKPKLLSKPLSTSRGKGIHHTLSSQYKTKSSQDIKLQQNYQQPIYTQKPIAPRVNKQKEILSNSDRMYVLSPPQYANVYRRPESNVPSSSPNAKRFGAPIDEFKQRPSLQYMKKIQRPNEKLFYNVASPTKRN